MAKSFEIIGGRQLNGTVVPIPNKNSLMGALPVAALAEAGVIYNHVPQTSDVDCFLALYKKIGAKVKRLGTDKVLIAAKNINTYKLDLATANKMRSSFMLAGPLLAKFGRAEVPLPGGCKLGFRSMSAHVDSFRQMGITTKAKGDFLQLAAPKLVKEKYNVWLMEASVTATINTALYAIGRGINVDIIDAACEPHVSDVLRLLQRMGANISGVGTNKIQVRKTKKLNKAEFTASPDHVDIAGYITAGALTKGRIKIKGANIPEIIDGLLNWFELFGVKIKRSGNDLIVEGAESSLKINKKFFSLAGKNLPKLSVRPWPGFPVDVLPTMIVLACRSKGAVLFKNWMYESGFGFVSELNFMGADIYISDPEKIIVPENIIDFVGGEVYAPRVIEGTKALFLAALSSRRKTIIHEIDILKRRYPNIFEVYKKLGAEIKVFKDKMVRC